MEKVLARVATVFRLNVKLIISSFYVHKLWLDSDERARSLKPL